MYSMYCTVCTYVQYVQYVAGTKYLLPNIPNILNILSNIDQNSHFPKRRVLKKKKTAPAASLFSRKQGLGVPIHIKMSFILNNIIKCI